MTDNDIKEVIIKIPSMQWTTWETMVNVALDESAGVLEYETSLAKQQSWVKFNNCEINEETLMENIKNRSGYTNLYIQN